MLWVELKTRHGLSWNFNALRMKTISHVFQSIRNLTVFPLKFLVALQEQREWQRPWKKSVVVCRNGRVKSGFQSYQTSVCTAILFFFGMKLTSLCRCSPGGSQVRQVASLLVNLPIFLEASVKRHFYYSMKNCTSPDDLRRRLLTIVDHYQVWHCQLYDAVCKGQNYWLISTIGMESMNNLSK